MEPLILKLGLALAIGLLVGLERGWREREAPAGSRTAGIRTYGIAGLLGGTVAALAQAAQNTLLFPIAFLAFAGVFAGFKWREAENDEDFSFTGVAAALSVFALGGLAVAGDHLSAAAGGAALAAVLASREMLHGLLQRLSWVEVRSALILAVMTAIILPLLPDKTIDPWGALNPREIWLFTLLAAALSYLGYIATRVLGEARGLLWSTLAGALVSSTVMTLSLARSPGNGRRLAGAASLAAMVSILRVLLFTMLLSPALLATAGPAALAAAVVFGLAGWLMLSGMSAEDMPKNQERNPFDLKPLLLFAAIYAGVALLSALSSRYFGTASLAVTSAVSGLVDVDAAVLSILRLAGGGVSPADIGRAVLVALASNGIVRFLGGAAAGPLAFSAPLAVVNVAAAAAGLAAFLLLPALNVS
jgi:uncharacterized membrane protein (DUF4010 family)